LPGKIIAHIKTLPRGLFEGLIHNAPTLEAEGRASAHADANDRDSILTIYQNFEPNLRFEVAKTEGLQEKGHNLWGRNQETFG
jgi:hypothetical protein